MMAQSKANGSHYALTAIGLGMLVLGIIMAVWNLVPGFSHADKPSTHGNSSSPSGGILKSKTFSVAYVLVGAGIMLLLLSICLSIRDKRKQRQGEEEIARIQHNAAVASQTQEEDSQEEEESHSRYYVPSYEEVMNTNYSEVRELNQNPGMNISLPSYESLTGLDETTPTTAHADGETHLPDRQNSRLAKRLKPLKVRRIKSEKLHLKDFRINLPEGNLPPPTIEPLTPPPQYDEVQEKAATDTRSPN
ncbi:transmembrane protein 51 [Antechinus flavipes]|uniref:Transmembrane protein 51 n=1 Tax=Sarcophilus harrisii TaxID=9305 RepID=A0A7N4NXK7_SARHA|nr:transmembrane protein 51 [Sarcophilus harrisii]XP_031818681.1 transmembrane protein 51 [Sarcophilus harrisii]XP_031818682.1 transmembrane protein 51 [Sarcophilus harrisii]XP_031818683.1 transmembrane protein 51 [Sarcophilus harrisii]XP_051844465.1 transmembrane protein 51 [Antechinus flavipes]XP_051844466.1 transmembrane protein 51 [Antechinus flavipes]XP_051844467.1 transmembrane protein 51 [Antechinus flavipes]XP_051844469.1 transmembrane protein 51 [Antechinus flavipes]